MTSDRLDGRVARVREGDATGYGIMESIISGVWPDLGLGAESDHRVSYTG